jgi:alpha-mannosidase
VYEFTKADYAEIKEYTDSVINGKLSSIAAKIGTDGGVLVYNPLGHERAGTFTLDGTTYYTGEKIPAMGYAVINPSSPTLSVKISDLCLENDFYTVKFDKAGRITSLFDKENDREVVLPGTVMNELQAFEDNPYMYDAWEMEEYMQTKPYILDTDATVTKICDGDRAGFVFERKYQSSTIKQTVWLYSSSRRIDFDHDIDWQDNHQILKLAFPLDVYATSAKFDIQFGHTSRPTHRNTSWDSAKFEVCAHKWVDLSENGYGVALLNDCKYGFSVEESTLKLTCLKSATNPDETADIGKHTFTCSLLPHKGTLTEGGVIDEAYALNQPLEAKRISASCGTAPERFSLVEAKEEAVVIEAVKCAEDGSYDTIVRFYEAFGGKIKAHIAVADGFKEAYLCDLCENVIEALPIENGFVTVPLHQFEIGTLRLKK